MREASSAKGGVPDQMGTTVSAYSEQGPFHCGDCVWASQYEGLEEPKALCTEPHVLRDAEVKTHEKTGLKIIDLIHGCCRYVRYPKGYVEEAKER